MFDELIKQIKKLGEAGISVPVEMDDEGYYDRECPNKECLFQFKVFGEDWVNLCKDETIYCPFCRHEAPSKSWWTKEQLSAAKKQAHHHINATINKGLSEGARAFNRQQRPSLITMSMTFSGGIENHRIVPIAAQEAMKLKIKCENCSTRFAVIGSAFFCPCCGFNSVERTFDDSLKKVEAKLNNLETVRTTLENAVDKDTAEITCRSLIETGINDCVVAFQKLMESLYVRTPKAKKLAPNVFQRIEDGSTLWKESTNEGYEDWVTLGDLNELKILFQKRHLLAHTEGFVDEKYISKSGDLNYLVGQRIVVRENDVRRLVALVKALTDKARSKA